MCDCQEAGIFSPRGAKQLILGAHWDQREGADPDKGLIRANKKLAVAHQCQPRHSIRCVPVPGKLSERAQVQAVYVQRGLHLQSVHKFPSETKEIRGNNICGQGPVRYAVSYLWLSWRRATVSSSFFSWASSWFRQATCMVSCWFLRRRSSANSTVRAERAPRAARL